MSITSALLNRVFQSRLIAFRDPDLRRAIQQRQTSQADLEKSLMERTDACSLPTIQTIRERLPSLKVAELKKLINAPTKLNASGIRAVGTLEPIHADNASMVPA